MEELPGEQKGCMLFLSQPQAVEPFEILSELLENLLQV